ncbi:MAG: oligosaccharide flippase family protein, partial [Saprospiraceae bacterium]
LLIQPLFVINPLINKVSFPIMAQVQDDPLRLRRFALRAVQWIAAVNAPIYAASWMGASLLVPALFGADWVVAVEPFRWLALCFLFRTLLNPLGAIVFAKGRLGRSIVFQAMCLPVFICFVYIGLYSGLTVMIQFLVAYYALQLAGYLMWVARPHAPLTLHGLLSHTGLEIACAMVSFGAAFLPVSHALWLAGAARAGMFLALGSALYFACMYVVRPNMRDEFFQMFRKAPTT